MLQDIRENIQGTLAKVVVGLIVIAFAFWGVQTILLGGGSNAVAEVNGEEISPAQLRQAVTVEQRRVMASMGDNVDPAKLEEQALSKQAMQSLIQRTLATQAAGDLGLRISNAQVGAAIAGMPQFQQDGQFSEQMYRAILSDAGYSPASFKQTIGGDLLLNQLASGLAGSDFATPAELTIDARVVGEQRDVRYLTIPLDAFRSNAEVSEKQIAEYYAANADSLQSPESVELDYIELRPEDFRQPVEEQRVRDAYEQELQNRQYQTENRVSHILLVQKDGESDEAYQKRIAQVQADLAGGGDFAELARKYSDDPGSSANGGDLGYSSGDVFPAPMEAAVSKLSVGEVSAPVTTEAGTHFILLTERREGKPPSFEELRPQLEEELAMADARAELLRTVESLKDLSFNADDLDGPAKELGLTVSHSGKVTRDQAEGLFAAPSLLSAAFSEDVLDAGHNSDVIELNSDHWVVLHVRQHNPPEQLPLAAVHDEIKTRIADAEARQAVLQAAQAAMAALRDGQAMDSVAQSGGYDLKVELGVDRRSTTLPQEVLRDAFRLQAPAEGQAVANYVPATTGDVYVYELTRVTPGTPGSLPEDVRQYLQRAVSGEHAQLVDSEYRQALREAADIKVMM